MNKYYGIVGLFFVAACGRNEAPASQTKDVIVYETQLACKADWACEGETTARGNVTSTGKFVAGQNDLCKENLLSQVKPSGVCSGAYAIVPDTFSFAETKVELTLLTCANGAGASLCNAMAELVKALAWECTGSACYSIWEDQLEKMAAVRRIWDRSQNPKNLVSAEIADKAERTSRKMCAQERTGDVGQMVKLTKATNETGLAFAAMQRAANRSHAYTCKHSVN